MRSIILSLIGIWFLSGTMSAQKNLALSLLFAGEYNRNNQAVVVIVKGKKLEPYHLTLFHSIDVKNSEEDVKRFEKAVLADGRKAESSEIVKVGQKIVACYYQLPPEPNDSRKRNRFILFRKDGEDRATTIYLEGNTELDALIKIFINKNK